MIQVLIKKGRVFPAEVPAPCVSDGGVFVKVVYSCISAGTELSSLKKSQESLIKKAMAQPEKLLKVLDMAKSKGVAGAWKNVKGKLEAEKPTGYSISGIVLAVGKGVTGFQPGDRVCAAGAGIANHAEYVDVPFNLVIPIPDGLEFISACTVALGGIAIQGVRRTSPEMGEIVVVMGAGVIGQLAVQLLCASGVRVIAVDLNEGRLKLSQQLGAEAIFNPAATDIVQSIIHYTNGQGADAVLFCASTTSPDALSNAFKMTRKKGKVVMVGVWGNVLNREDIYRKEIDFLISTSYGPGRYDTEYEQKGQDYPYAYVRWTENRNMQEYVRLMASDKVRVLPLIQGEFPVTRAEEAFASLQSEKRPLMVMLNYGKQLPEDISCLAPQERRLTVSPPRPAEASRVFRVGVIGAGKFAVSVHLPNLKKLSGKFSIRAVCSRTGSNARNIAGQFGCSYATTDHQEILNDPDIDLIMVCTRHNLHGQLVLESLKSGKHVFVEKPLCTTETELRQIETFFSEKENFKSGVPILTVGFNRRFSRYAAEIKKRIQGRTNPLLIHYRMNAGYFPPDHWVHSEEGGGRIIGEGCHIIDLFSFLTESTVKAFNSSAVRPVTGSLSGSDNRMITIEYEDGSLSLLQYFSLGSKSLPKEQMEIHFDGKSILMSDYQSLDGYDIAIQSIKSSVPEKGQLEELEELYLHLSGQKQGWPISLESLLETTELTFRAA